MKSIQKTKKHLHFRRFEFKYWLSPDKAKLIEEHIAPYMRIDPFVVNEAFYGVHSIYWDSPDFKSYYEKIFGIPNRKKIRLRTYTNADVNPGYYLEIKRKIGPVIIKDRHPLTKAELPILLDTPEDLKDVNAPLMEEFNYEVKLSQMTPKLLVSYKRKPMFSILEDNFRVTFDYDIKYRKVEDIDFTKSYDSSFNKFVILEIKFNGQVPQWFRKTIEIFALERDKFSKYCVGVADCFAVNEIE